MTINKQSIIDRTIGTITRLITNIKAVPTKFNANFNGQKNVIARRYSQRGIIVIMGKEVENSFAAQSEERPTILKLYDGYRIDRPLRMFS